MENNFDINSYFKATVYKNEKNLRKFFDENAIIRWYNTNEVFTLEKYLKVNCNYPNEWDYILERIEIVEDLIITVAKVFGVNVKEEHRVVSFIKIYDNKIISLEEYWGIIGEKPNFR